MIRIQIALCALLLLGSSASFAQTSTAIAADPAKPFDPVAATQAYLDTVPAADRARTDAYYEGGYWLLLWDFALGVGVNLLLLPTGISRRMRDLSERVTKVRAIHTFAYWVQYLLVTTVVLLPMLVYEGFFREHQYGLMNQDFGAWFGDQLKGLGVTLVFGGLAMMALYGVVRRLPRSWALWGAATLLVFEIIGAILAPVYVAPLFNKYEKLSDPAIAGPILKLARAEGIDVDDVYVFDASRQTKRVSANVSGFASTMRISLNDNLLNRSSMAEIEPVMGHEMGHYVLHHVYKSTLFLGVVIVIGFAFLKWSFDQVLARRGAAWGIRGSGDTAGLPLAYVLITAYFFVLTPVLNSYTRVEEAEADLFGVNASGQPDGEAIADLKLGEYRKLDPGPLEEILFFDHPSGRSRILMAMRWKAQHLAEARENYEAAAAIDRARGWSPETAAAWAKAHEPK